MWVISGPFDGEVGVVDFNKSKLLKPNTTYSLGRKNQPLIVNNKKISQHECDFVVGPQTINDAGDPSFKPSLTLIYRSARHPIGLRRDGREPIMAQKDEQHLLHDGDGLHMSNGVIVKVQWQPICAFYPPGRGNLAISVEKCASLGIKLVPTMCDNLTHHLANHYEASLRMASSVLSLCKIVKPEWLVEVLKLGHLPRDNDSSEGTSLEDYFILPAETKYRPSFSASLLPEYKKFKIWEPNEDRINILSPFRFICLQEKVTDLDTDLKEVIRHGNGGYEAFDIHSGVSKFHTVLTRAQAKEGKMTVVVGDTDSMHAAVGNEQWKEYVTKANSFSLEIFPPSKIVQAVLEANVDPLRSNLTESAKPVAEDSSLSPLPQMVLNTLSEEPSRQRETPIESAQPTRRKLVRRTVSRAPSEEPSNTPPLKVSEAPVVPAPAATNTEGEGVQPRPRRVLTRRLATVNPAAIGMDEPSVSMEQIPELPSRKTPEPTMSKIVAPTPARAKLKRRFGGDDNPPAPLPHETATLSGMGATPEEPALKKFKALFEASNPVESEPYDFTTSLPNGSQTQSQSQSEIIRRGRALGSVGASTLSILREEEEETPTLHQNGSKRKLSHENEDAMEVDDDAVGPATKKRAVDNANAITRTDELPKVGGSKNVSTQGAPVGKPDTDAAFLKAIASTKRGKKTEDAFDREFNKLKISKPDLDRPDPEEEWKVLADFGDDSGLRGNFMVVVEMDVYKKDDSARNSRSTNPEWNGKPNFKKFKKKITGATRPKVELVISEANDYGIGTSYWKGGNSQAQMQRHNSFGTQMETTTQRTREANDLAHAFDDDEDTDEPTPPIRTTRKPAGSTVQTKKSTTKGKAPAKNRLFLDSDDDIQEVSYEADDLDEQRDDDQTLPSSAEVTKKPAARKPSTRATSVTKKPAPIILDDSDDGAVFKGFKGSKGR